MKGLTYPVQNIYHQRRLPWLIGLRNIHFCVESECMSTVGLASHMRSQVNFAQVLLQPPTNKSCQLSKFLRRSLLIFIIKVFRTIVFIFIVISTMFRPICPPAFFRWPEFDKHLKKAGGHIGRNVVEITIKMKTIVRKTLMIKVMSSMKVCSWCEKPCVSAQD